MITLRKSEERGLADHGWLKSFHSFSFADYHDPAHMGFGNLRVINEDSVAPARASARTATATWRSSATCSMANSRTGTRWATSRPSHRGDVQRMSAGRGVMHSEFNHAKDKTTHFLQIWILPNVRGIEPGYEQKRFPDEDKRGRLRLVASPDGANGSVTIHADARCTPACSTARSRRRWRWTPRANTTCTLSAGALTVNGQALGAGDAAQLQHETQLDLTAGEQAEVLVFDLHA